MAGYTSALPNGTRLSFLSHPTQQHLTSNAPRAREVAWQILQRHRELGTSQKLAAIRRAHAGRSEDEGRDGAPSAMLTLFWMAVYHGVIEDGCDGLMVYTPRKEIARAAGFSEKSLYVAFRDLEAVGAIKVFHRGGPEPDFFEVLPIGEIERAEAPPPQPPPDPPATPTPQTQTRDFLRAAILQGGAFTPEQQDLLLAMLVRIERIEARERGEA